ncbi:hypothetical protein M427DRAFT_266297 [Gonapodya prolifera JEL478]|uniref:SWIRM domain-containing protein n=1 Tax=Gonapodya prolifera (strain JEL478) TaxID=1344416 RepID=A0A139AKH8_GONPJ|nr:hypothetical protein M427DRAFT_266297 [Gonapodya prolifera JEL478]|eukprot:KXS17276.1 hypothetical protein M427DRAFT_266297 [Gonapodya prolifera JEL478]
MSPSPDVSPSPSPSRTPTPSPFSFPGVVSIPTDALSLPISTPSYLVKSTPVAISPLSLQTPFSLDAHLSSSYRSRRDSDTRVPSSVSSGYSPADDDILVQDNFVSSLRSLPVPQSTLPPRKRHALSSLSQDSNWTDDESSSGLGAGEPRLSSLRRASSSPPTPATSTLPEISIVPADEPTSSTRAPSSTTSTKKNRPVSKPRRPSLAQSESSVASTASTAGAVPVRTSPSPAPGSHQQLSSGYPGGVTLAPGAYVVKPGESVLGKGRFMDTEGKPAVFWKGQGQPLPPDTPLLHLLTPEEISSCESLRLSPAQYLSVKDSILTAAWRSPDKVFRKGECRQWFKMDVNKIGRIYDWFDDLGWLPWSARASPPPPPLPKAKPATAASTTAADKPPRAPWVPSAGNVSTAARTRCPSPMMWDAPPPATVWIPAPAPVRHMTAVPVPISPADSGFCDSGDASGPSTATGMGKRGFEDAFGWGADVRDSGRGFKIVSRVDTGYGEDVVMEEGVGAGVVA